MSIDEVLDAHVVEIANLVRAGSVSAAEIARAALERASRSAALGAFLNLCEDEVIAAANEVDAARAAGRSLGALAGVPLGVKDPICTKGTPTTAGSAILTSAPKPWLNIRGSGSPAASSAPSPGETANDPARGWRPPYDATVVEKLRANGALLLGKCNMDEFAMGSSNENSAFFPARNPWDPDRTPGGSSGGSAAAVAAGLVPAALGTDTGGSIRQPASLTGTVGVKPTYGRVSRYGLIAFASSLDQIGPLTSDVRGAARVLGAIAGHDPRDSTSLDAPVPDYEAACGKSIRGTRIGVPAEYFAKGIEPEVEQSVRAAISALEAEGCSVVPVDLPHTRHAVATYYVVATAECSSNLARFDGVRFGFRAGSKTDLGSMYASTRGAGFGREVKRRILLGTFVLSAGYYDAYYLHAQRVRTLIRRDFEQAFANVDVILAPVSPTVAFKLGEKIDDPLAMYLADVYTLPASLAGIAALSVPARPAPAKADRPVLPIGLQLIAPSLGEERLFSMAHAWESLCPPVRAPRLSSRSS